MKIAITGGTGFVGRHVAAGLVSKGRQIVLVTRARSNAATTSYPMGLDSVADLARAFAGCQGVVHCAGINREIGGQTYQRVHIDGTRHVVEAARQAGVKKIILVSFLRARPDCGSGYHESKWAAEEMVRGSGLDYTVLKCGVIYGRGDHMLDHLSHAFYTFPVFALVGFKDKPIRPNAVEDVARIIEAAVDGALSRATVAVLGPEQLTLRQAVCRVARVVGKRPAMFPMPVWFHYLLGWGVERLMVVPLVSTAQVQMLAEGLAAPAPPCDLVPNDLASRVPFGDEQIRKGLPLPGPFGWGSLRCCHRPAQPHSRIVFFEMP